MGRRGRSPLWLSLPGVKPRFVLAGLPTVRIGRRHALGAVAGGTCGRKILSGGGALAPWPLARLPNRWRITSSQRLRPCVRRLRRLLEGLEFREFRDGEPLDRPALGDMLAYPRLWRLSGLQSVPRSRGEARGYCGVGGTARRSLLPGLPSSCGGLGSVIKKLRSLRISAVSSG